MQIELSKIVSSPQAIRTTWDEEKMQELVASLEEYGLLQAIKVRPVGDKYEIVYGHRRAEASRRAGLTHIEAVVEGLKNIDQLFQAIIENVQREDISNYDQGLGYKRLRGEGGLSQREIARIVGKAEQWVGQCILLTEDEDAKELNLNLVSGAAEKFKIIRGALGDDLEARRAAMSKVAREGLTVEDTRRLVADMKREPRQPQGVHLDLSSVGKPTAEEVVDKHLADQERAKEKAFWETHKGGMAHEMRRALSSTRKELDRCWARIEKYPTALPAEHIPYIESRVRKLGKHLIDLADKLNAKRLQEIDNDQE